MTQLHPLQPIDAVITWVDGNTVAHRRLRAQYMAQEGLPLGENARNPHRWESSGEITFCLHSIHNHAPWVRIIWIIVDRDPPPLDSLPAALRAKVRIVTHDTIFAGYANALPTFNSLAIETVMWRIKGLSEQFLYFNDDVFLSAPLSPEDVFVGGHPVLRGQWRDNAALANDPAARDDPAMFGHLVQINAAALAGYSAEHLFAAAHVVHPMRRSIMQQLFATHRPAVVRNIAGRFRQVDQFLPQGAHNHLAIRQGEAVISEAYDWVHIKSGQGVGVAPGQTRAALEAAAQSGIRFLCVTDLPQLEALVHDARALIARVTGAGID